MAHVPCLVAGQVDSTHVLIVAGLLLLGLLLLAWKWPAVIFRPIVWLITHTVYRITGSVGR